MSSNQETMRTTIATAGVTALASKNAAIQASITTIHGSGCDVGYKPGDPTGNAAYVAAVKSAAQTLADSRAAAEMAKIAAVNAAKDLLRSQGEIPF